MKAFVADPFVAGYLLGLIMAGVVWFLIRGAPVLRGWIDRNLK